MQSFIRKKNPTLSTKKIKIYMYNYDFRSYHPALVLKALVRCLMNSAVFQLRYISKSTSVRIVFAVFHIGEVKLVHNNSCESDEDE